MKFKYSFTKEKTDNMAKSYGRDLSISNKNSVEICNLIRGKKVVFAKNLLEKIINLERPVPMKKFNRDTAHKKNIGPGRYPIKTAKEILSVLKSAESNVINKGLSTNDLVIDHIAAHKASRPWHYGRKRRQKMKRTHIEVILVERKIKNNDIKDNENKK